MPLIMPDQQFPPMPVIVMIVGTPFSYKSSMSMTAKNAVHIDGDRGGQRAIRNCPVLKINSWNDVLLEERSGTFKPFSTVILDTPKSINDDYLWNWSQSVKFYADDRKVYGAIATEFKRFVAALREDEKDIVIVSHETSKDSKDVTAYAPDITNATKQLLLRMCDQVGFMYKKEIKVNGGSVIQTILTFNPTPEYPFCKNVAGLEDIVIPHYTSADWKDFMNNRIIQPTKDAMLKMTTDQKKTLDFIDEWRSAIDVIQDDGRDVDAELKAITKDIKEQVTADHLQKQVLNYLVLHYKAIGWKYDGKQTKFLKVDTTAPAVKVEMPPAQAAEAEKPAEPVAETAPVVVIEAEQAAPVINANPHMPPPAVDLFAPRKD